MRWPRMRQWRSLFQAAGFHKAARVIHTACVILAGCVSLACCISLAGCVSPASVPEQTHPLATALPETPAASAPDPTAVATPSQSPMATAEPLDPNVAMAAGYLETLTGCDFSSLPYTVEFHDANGEEENEWDVSFTLPQQPVTANVRFTEAGELTFYALWTHGQTDESLELPLAPQPEELAEADYKETLAYWYGLLPIREDAPFQRTELVRRNDRRQYEASGYALSVAKMRFADGSVLTCYYDQGTKRLTYFCHYTAKSLGR